MASQDHNLLAFCNITCLLLSDLQMSSYLMIIMQLMATSKMCFETISAISLTPYHLATAVLLACFLTFKTWAFLNIPNACLTHDFWTTTVLLTCFLTFKAFFANDSKMCLTFRLVGTEYSLYKDKPVGPVMWCGQSQVVTAIGGYFWVRPDSGFPPL